MANFSQVLKGARGGEKVVPLLRSYLYDPSFPSFTVKVEGFKPRPPDYWFHPSTHPLWPERLLYLYMTRPEDLVNEPFDPTSTLAVTAGSFFHSFVQISLVAAGVLERQPVVCGCGGKHPERAEVYLRDEESRTRGHADGLLVEGDGFEFKTMNPMKLYKMPKGSPTDLAVLEWFKERCPAYYAQAHDYMRMSGRRLQVVVFLALTYPFEMREIHVPYDAFYARDIRDRYLRVLQAAADQQMPPDFFCCKKNGCPGRVACQEISHAR
jgi:hypothetical protein